MGHQGISTRQRMIAAIHRALVDEMQHRHEHPDDWIDREREAVTTEANRWATAYDRLPITVEDVERIEHLAMGHVDYATKLALQVALLVLPQHRPLLPPPPQEEEMTHPAGEER